MTGFGKTCIVHTSDFSTLAIHKISYEWQINVKLAGIVDPLFFYYSWKFQIFMPFSVVVMDLQMWKIGCVNYARFPKSGHIYTYVILHQPILLLCHTYSDADKMLYFFFNGPWISKVCSYNMHRIVGSYV